jgi:hypothetical protein
MTAVANERGTRRPLDFNETLSQPMDYATDASPLEDMAHLKHAGAAERELTNEHRIQSNVPCSMLTACGTPPTTRKRMPPMPQEKYRALRTMLMSRREQREASQLSMVDDTERCKHVADKLECEELSRAQSEWEDQYEWLRTCLEGSPATKSYLMRSTGGSSPGLEQSGSALQQGSPSVAARSLRPVLEAINNVEKRRVEFLKVQALEKDLLLARDRMRIRSEGFVDERIGLEQELMNVKAETKKYMRQEEQIREELACLPQEEVLEAQRKSLSDALTASQELIANRREEQRRREEQMSSTRDQLRNAHAVCSQLESELRECLLRSIVLSEEPQTRCDVEADEARCVSAIVHQRMQDSIIMERRSAAHRLERVSTQLEELQRLTGGIDGSFPSAEEVVQRLRKEREHAVAEVREINSEMVEMEGAIEEICSDNTFVLPHTTSNFQAELETAKANLRAMELVLERRRTALDEASSLEEERRVIFMWLTSDEHGVSVPQMFADIDGARDTLATYRTLQRQCVLLGQELANVHAQQQEQDDFTSLGLYHRLESEVADVDEGLVRLDSEERALTTEVEALKAREIQTCDARNVMMKQQDDAAQEVDLLRNEETNALTEIAALRNRLHVLHHDSCAFQQEESAHQEERQRRYLMRLGVIPRGSSSLPNDNADTRAREEPSARRAGGGRERTLRSRQEILLEHNLQDRITVVTTHHAASTGAPVAKAAEVRPSWWWPWRSRDMYTHGGTI